MAHKGYSLSEKKSILNYIISKKGYTSVKGRKFWVDFAESGVTNRTWQSLKEVFRKRILPDLNNPYYCLTKDNIRNIKNGASALSNSIEWTRKISPDRTSKTNLELKSKEYDDSIVVSDSDLSLLNGGASNESAGPSKINKSPMKKLSTTPEIFDSEPEEKSVISDSQNNNQSEKQVKEEPVASESARKNHDIDMTRNPRNSTLMMSLLSSDSDQSSPKYDMKEQVRIREFTKVEDPKRKSLIRKMRESHSRPLLNTVVGKVKIRQNFSGSDDSRCNKYQSLALKRNVHRETMMRHSTSTESVCSSSDYSDDFSESNHKSHVPMYVINKGKVYPLYYKDSTKVKQCHYELCSNRKRRSLPHKHLKPKHRRLNESFQINGFCCREVEKAYYRKCYKYCSGGKLGKRPKASDFMNLEKLFTLKHHPTCKFADIVDEDVERDNFSTAYLDQNMRESASKRTSSLLQMEFPSNDFKMCYMRDLENYYNNGQIGPKPIKENYQRVVTTEEKSHHDTSPDIWKLKYLEEKKRNEELARLLHGECSKSANERDSYSENKVKSSKPGPKSSKRSKDVLDANVIILSDDVVDENKLSPSKEQNISKAVISDKIIEPEKKCDLKVKVSMHGEDVLENAFNLNTQLADKFINLLREVKSVDKNADDVISTKVENPKVPDEPEQIDLSKIVEKEKEIFDEIFAENHDKEEIELKRQLFSSLELKMLLSDGNDEQKDVVKQSQPENEEFINGINEQSTPKTMDTELKIKPTKIKANVKQFSEKIENPESLDDQQPKERHSLRIKKTSEVTEMSKSNNAKLDNDTKNETTNEKEPKKRGRKPLAKDTDKVVSSDDKRTTRSNKEKMDVMQSGVLVDEQVPLSQKQKTTEVTTKASKEKGEKSRESLNLDSFFDENVKFGFPKISSSEPPIMIDAKMTRSRHLTQSPKSNTPSQKRYFECIVNERPSETNLIDFNDECLTHQPSIIDTIDLDDTLLIDQSKLIRFTSHLKTDSIENEIIEDALRFPNKIPPSTEINLEGQEKNLNSVSPEKDKTEQLFSSCGSLIDTQYLKKMGYFDSESSHSEEYENSPETKAINMRELCPLTLKDMMSEESV